MYMTFRNEAMIHEGRFKVDMLLLLAFLYCSHKSRNERREEFWLLLDPELTGKVTAEKVIATYEKMVHIVTKMRLDIERERDEGARRKHIIDYLEKLENVDVKKFIKESILNEENEGKEYTKDELLRGLRMETLNATGLRISILK